MAEPIIWIEPRVFAAGDTLKFQRNLPSYTPGNGWGITYTLTQNTPAGAKVALNFVSQPDATNTYHVINVANFADALDPGTYTLSGEVICSATGESPNEKHLFYLAELELDPDLQGGLAQAPLQTFAEQMIPILQAKILRLESYDLTETDVQRTRFVIEDKSKTYERYKYFLELRLNEKRLDIARNTGHSRVNIPPAYAGGW